MLSASFGPVGRPCSPGFGNLVGPPGQVGLAGFQVLSLALSGLKVNGEGGWAQWEFGGGRSWRIREISEVIALNYTLSAKWP